MTTSTFVHEKRVAVQSYRKVLTGERVGPYGHDEAIVPWLLELNAIPGCYSWASCAGHAENGARGFVWVALRYVPARPPAWLDADLCVAILYPFQESARKIAFEFAGGAGVVAGQSVEIYGIREPLRENTLERDMALVLEYLWGLPTG